MLIKYLSAPVHFLFGSNPNWDAISSVATLGATALALATGLLAWFSSHKNEKIHLYDNLFSEFVDKTKIINDFLINERGSSPIGQLVIGKRNLTMNEKQQLFRRNPNSMNSDYFKNLYWILKYLDTELFKFSHKKRQMYLAILRAQIPDYVMVYIYLYATYSSYGLQLAELLRDLRFFGTSTGWYSSHLTKNSETSRLFSSGEFEIVVERYFQGEGEFDIEIDRVKCGVRSQIEVNYSKKMPKSLFEIIDDSVKF
ncbi:putative phage abortive infection protein [Weissella cibaria]